MSTIVTIPENYLADGVRNIPRIIDKLDLINSLWQVASDLGKIGDTYGTIYTLTMPVLRSIKDDDSCRLRAFSYLDLSILSDMKYNEYIYDVYPLRSSNISHMITVSLIDSSLKELTAKIRLMCIDSDTNNWPTFYNQIFEAMYKVFNEIKSVEFALAKATLDEFYVQDHLFKSMTKIRSISNLDDIADDIEYLMGNIDALFHMIMSVINNISLTINLSNPLENTNMNFTDQDDDF